MKITTIAAAVLLSTTSTAFAQTYFDEFTPLSTSQTSALPAAAPVKLSSPNFSQVTIARSRHTRTPCSPGSNSGNWDMITANESGPDAGRYLFMPFETGTRRCHARRPLGQQLQHPHHDHRGTWHARVRLRRRIALDALGQLPDR